MRNSLYWLNSQNPSSGRLDKEWQIQRVTEWLLPKYGEEAEMRARRIVNKCRRAAGGMA